MSQYIHEYYVSVVYLKRALAIYASVIMCSVMAAMLAVQPWLEEYWIRNAPQGELLLQSVGKKVEVWRSAGSDVDTPMVVLGTIARVNIQRRSLHRRALVLWLEDIVTTDTLLGRPDRSPTGCGVSVGPYEMDRVRVIGHPVLNTSPLPIGLSSALCLIAVGMIAGVFGVFQPFAKRLWFLQGHQVRALRSLVGQRVQWWTSRGVIIGKLKAVTAKRSWRIRHSFYQTMIQIEGDGGELHCIPFTSIGLVWRLHPEERTPGGG